MTKEQLTDWALAHGWRMMGAYLSLAKPNRPNEAIVRLVLKTTVAQLEAKKPAGKWEKLASCAYKQLVPDEDSGVPRGLGLVSTPGFAKLMQDNRDAQVFAAR